MQWTLGPVSTASARDIQGEGEPAAGTFRVFTEKEVNSGGESRRTKNFFVPLDFESP